MKREAFVAVTLAVAFALTTGVGLAEIAATGDVDKPEPTPLERCEAERDRLRSVLIETSDALIRFGVNVKDAARPQGDK